MKQVKVLTIKDVLERAVQRQKEFDALPEEEKKRLLEKREEILKKLRGKPGFAEFRFKK